MITPSLNVNLPSPSASSAAAKAVVPPPAAPAAAAPAPVAAPSPAPSSTVTLSPQAMNALAAGHAPSPPSGMTPGLPAPSSAAHESSTYESLKKGLSTAVTDIGDAIAGGAHAVVDGVETAVSTANTVAQGVLELPFAAVSKACDAAGALIDDL